MNATAQNGHSRKLLLTLVAAAVAVAAVGAVLVLRRSNGPTTALPPQPSSTTVTSGPTGTTAGSAPATNPSGPAGPLKAPLRGLLDRNGPPPPEFIGTALQGWVVQAYWEDLQPAPGGPITENNAIDQAINTARDLNRRDPALGLGLKLRVYAGINAPEWAKRLGGEPIRASSPQSGRTGTVGRFWTEPFGRAYDDLMVKLAARYDAVPEVREVVISRCATVFAEPFLRNRGDRQQTQDLLAAGFTVAADETCHRQQIDAHKVWQQTRSDLVLNPYQDITARGPERQDEAFTEDKMQYCRSTLGARCVLENNSLASPPKYPEMYATMKRLGPPIAFQTATPDKVGDLGQALKDAVGLGAASVELPFSYKAMAPADLAAADAALRQNPG